MSRNKAIVESTHREYDAVRLEKVLLIIFVVYLGASKHFCYEIHWMASPEEPSLQAEMELLMQEKRRSEERRNLLEAEVARLEARCLAEQKKVHCII